MDKPKREPLMSVGRVAVEHGWYDADEIDAWLRDEVLRDARMHLRLQERYGISSKRTRALIAQLEDTDG